MIHDVDESLRGLLAIALADHKDVTVSFDAPTQEWAATRGKKSVLNLWLYDVREDLKARQSDYQDIRNDEGRVIGRQPPLRHYDLSYLVSAWTDDAGTEHTLLAAVLAGVPEREMLPTDLLAGTLIDWGAPLPLRAAAPERVANHWDLWSALGVGPRSSLELVVSAPLVPPMSTEVGPPAEEFRLGMGQRQPPAPRRKSAGGMPTPSGADGEKRWPRRHVDES